MASSVGSRRSSSPIIRIIKDTLGIPIGADTIYPPSGDSTGTSDNRWSSTEARITWRQDRWWITARAGRVASTRQASALWAGVQAGAELSHGVSLLLGAGKSSRSLTYTGDEAQRHISASGLASTRRFVAAWGDACRFVGRNERRVAAVRDLRSGRRSLSNCGAHRIGAVGRDGVRL